MQKKILTRHEINDCIAQQIESVITQVCKESKLWIHPTYGGHLIIHLSSLTFVFKK